MFISISWWRWIVESYRWGLLCGRLGYNCSKWLSITFQL